MLCVCKNPICKWRYNHPLHVDELWSDPEITSNEYCELKQQLALKSEREFLLLSNKRFVLRMKRSMIHPV